MTKPLSYQNRITIRTAPDVVEAVGTALSRLQRAGLKFRGRKLGLEGLVGAVLAEFSAKTLEEQVAVLRLWLPELERSLDHDPGKPGQASSEAQPSPEPHTMRNAGERL